MKINKYYRKQICTIIPLYTGFYMSYQEQTDYNYYATDHIDPLHTLVISGAHAVNIITKIIVTMVSFTIKTTYDIIEEIAIMRYKADT